MSLTQPQHNKLTRLKRRLKLAGITQRQIATLAAVTVPHVCSVLAGRYKSRKVLDAAGTLLAEGRGRAGKGLNQPAEALAP